MVYFAQMQIVPYLVKIGFTQEDNLSLRLGALKSECNSQLSLLMTIKGDRLKETSLHLKFQDICVGGEWFFPSKQLLRFISNLIDSEKLNLLKKNDFRGLIGFQYSIDNDYSNIIKEIKDKNRNLQSENNDLFEESKRLLSENIKLEAELKKLKPETRDINS